MKAYVSDTEDLKQDPLYQESWDDMIISVNFCIYYSFDKFIIVWLFPDDFVLLVHSFLPNLWMWFRMLIGCYCLEIHLQGNMNFINLIMSTLHCFIGNKLLSILCLIYFVWWNVVWSSPLCFGMEWKIYSKSICQKRVDGISYFAKFPLPDK